MNPDRMTRKIYRQHLAAMARDFDEAASLAQGPESRDEAADLHEQAEACRWALSVIDRVGDSLVHDLKIWPAYFEEVWNGHKTFEIRKDDRGFRVGDTLLLREWDPKTEAYTGRQVIKQVTYLTRGPSWGLPDDVVVMSIR